MLQFPIVLPVMLALILGAGAAGAQTVSGRISGRVVDAVTGAPLVGADVVVDGTSLVTATDRTGAFQFVGVPAGEVTVRHYLSRPQRRTRLGHCPGGQSVTMDVTLSPAASARRCRCAPSRSPRARRSALNQQRTALNITNVVSADQIGSFPDPNAAEAASRIPGVSIARDQGEGRYVLIRGTEARLNSMMIDGERIPSPEGDVRQVALDAVPADQLQAIEVSKAVTPDMDADSIGGAVNLITKQAVGRPTTLFSRRPAATTRCRTTTGSSNVRGTVGRRFPAAASACSSAAPRAKLDRGSENFEADYDDGDLEDLQTRDYQINRERYGVNGAARLSRCRATASPDASRHLQQVPRLRGQQSRRVSGRRLAHRARAEEPSAGPASSRSLSAAASTCWAARPTLDYRLTWARAQEDQPDRLDTIFRQRDVTFAPNVSAASIDPDNIQANPLNADLSKPRSLQEQINEPFLDPRPRRDRVGQPANCRSQQRRRLTRRFSRSAPR